MDKKELIEKLRKAISRHVGCSLRDVVIEDVTRCLNWALEDDNGEPRVLGKKRFYSDPALVEFCKKDARIKFGGGWSVRTRVLCGRTISIIPMIDEAYFLLDDSFEGFTVVRAKIENWHDGMRCMSISDVP